MKLPINIYCPTSKFDNIDRHGWRWYEPNDYRDAVIRYFLEGFQDAEDKHRHLLRFCHESITDKQMKKVLEYFKNFRIAFDAGKFGDDNHIEVLKDLYFEDDNGNSRKHKVFFG